MHGIKVIEDIFAKEGVPSLEGTFGPLLSGDHGACHFIDMPAGLYLDAHPHASESLIYTVRGQWVLHSGGQRWHMRAGSLFWFGDNVATGYEVPFAENAYILIFKSNPRPDDNAFLAYLREMAARLEADHAAGTPFRFHEIPDDHPAKVFARGLPGSTV
jgi:quercetin dioxygenase-like cupin family protein